MLTVLDTTKGLYTVNLAKVLFYYPIKSGKGARLEMEDGTLIDLVLSYDEVNQKFIEAGLSLSL